MLININDYTNFLFKNNFELELKLIELYIKKNFNLYLLWKEKNNILNNKFFEIEEFKNFNNKIKNEIKNNFNIYSLSNFIDLIENCDMIKINNNKENYNNDNDNNYYKEKDLKSIEILNELLIDLKLLLKINIKYQYLIFLNKNKIKNNKKK
jgi:hypothetical protein